MTEPSRLDAARSASDTRPHEWFRSPFVLLAGLILFVGALVLIVLTVSGGDEPIAADVTAGAEEPAPSPPPISFGGFDVPELGVVTLTGSTLADFGPDGDDPAVGTIAPQVAARSLANGNTIVLDTGRARVIGFFAHWCTHCQDELPEVAAWLADNELPPNTEFIAVSTAVRVDGDNYPPSAWFTSVGWAAPVILDDGDQTLLHGFGFQGFPSFVAIDASGFVVARASGNIGAAGLEDLFSKFAQ